ncbi:MAG TPA: phosphatase PAP2 family protein [Pyrinomonadaceae bacterium]|nr:phosphatase PAP2 family protein [Pyrinomonadaceae bacterium]
MLARISQHLDKWLLLSLAGALGALFFFAWLAEEMLEGETKAFDELVRAFVNSHASPLLTTIMRLVTELGSVLWLTVLGVCVVGAFILARWWRDVARFLITMAGAITLNITLKLSFARARPETFFETPVPASYSFPSGHALLSLCFYGAVAVIIVSRLQSRAALFLIWTFAALLVALIGYSRIYLGVHYPTDVLASYAVGLAWVSIVFFADHLHLRRRATTNHAL